MARLKLSRQASYFLILVAGIAIGSVVARAIRNRPVAPKALIQQMNHAEANAADSGEHEAPAYSEGEIAEYNSWVAEVVEASAADGSTAIVVSKSAYLLALVEGGNVVGTYPIELGGDPVGDKRCEGDQAIPEGVYRVTEKRGEGQTRFYKGLMINYPDEQDQEEFNRLREAGVLGPDDTIGGGIMVHGLGSGRPGNSGGVDWTLGCIALSNEEMDTVFDAAAAGTPVVITGYCSLLNQPGD